MKKHFSCVFIAIALLLLSACGSPPSSAPADNTSSESASDVSAEPAYEIDLNAPTGSISAWENLPSILLLTDGPAYPRVFSYEFPSCYSRFVIGCEVYAGSEKKLDTIIEDYSFTAEGKQIRKGDILISAQNRYVSYLDYFKKDIPGYRDGELIQVFEDEEVYNSGNARFPVPEGGELPADFGGIQEILCPEQPVHSGERIDLLFLTYAFDTLDNVISTPVKEALRSEGVEKALTLLREDTISYVFYIRFL